MLKITTAQFKHLGNYTAKQFPVSVAQAMRQDFKDELKDITDTELQSRVSEAIERMQLFGFEQKTHLHHLAAWEFFWGPDFENQPGCEGVKAIFNTQPELSKQYSLNLEAERFWGIYRVMMEVPDDFGTTNDDFFLNTTLQS